MTRRHTRAAWRLLALVALAWVALLGVGRPAWAHKPSDSYLVVTVADAQVRARWDIALRDLDYALGLDADGDGQLTWGEVRARHADIARYATARLGLAVDGRNCTWVAGEQLVDEHTDGRYTVLPLQAACGAVGNAAPQALTLDYRLFADLDPQHRGLLRLQVGGLTRTAVLGGDAPRQTLALVADGGAGPAGLAGATGPVDALLQYGREGVFHIWIGFDHILFLLALLLPAVGVWEGRRWRPAPRPGPAGLDVLKIVTAFTVAHSITLTAAALGYVSLPSRLVESAIALSVVLAALNNVWPVFHGRRWAVAFAFGLVHGFGFASVLADLGLPAGELAWALLGFNGGVELGQLAIVVAFGVLAYPVRATPLYRVGILRGGSLLIAALAAVWLVERAFDLALLPF